MRLRYASGRRTVRRGGAQQFSVGKTRTERWFEQTLSSIVAFRAKRISCTRDQREDLRDPLKEQMHMTMNGKAIAMAVAGLLLAVAPRVGHADDKTKEAKIKCNGINSCKGKAACAG
ncbi:MAG TPA: hypothetical protein VK601_30265, partial [Kofleriaceae bacterium]|nr:hypothetical protein [Kofleriaceae bacterium]